MADDVGAVTEFLGRVSGNSTTRAFSRPSLKDAVGVPAIQRSLTLISATTGMLTMQGWRQGTVMDGMDGRPESPRLIARPDPDLVPYTFYSSTAYDMASAGEFVWLIASTDSDGLASALVNVPLDELKVEENRDNRRRPTYKWGDIVSTRWSPANTKGRFVHVKYVGSHPMDLRGSGPIQRCDAATAISIEATAFAANFYGDGGYPREIIKKAGRLSSVKVNPITLEPDPDGMSEADIFREQWISRPNNVPRVIDESVESIETRDPNPQGAQMLSARQFQNGDAARMFGIPGSLLEYQEPGSSLTYQNLEGEFTKFIKVCLRPYYLDPIEQAMSDLLPRTTAAKFNQREFLQADVKTRFEVHQLAIGSGIYDAPYAQRLEGIAPGDVEFAPIPFAPPAAVPVTVPRVASTAPNHRMTCPICQRRLTPDGLGQFRCEPCDQGWRLRLVKRTA